MLERDIELEQLYNLKKSLELLPKLENQIQKAEQDFKNFEKQKLNEGVPPEPDRPNRPQKPIKPNPINEEYITELKKYKASLITYRERFSQYSVDMEKYVLIKAEKVSENRSNYASEIENSRKKCDSIRQNKRLVQEAIKNNTVLGKEDKTKVDIIDYVINKLENRRANSVVEALRLYDEERRRRLDEQSKLFLMEIERQRREQEEVEKTKQRMMDSIDQFYHNQRVESEAKRQADQAQRAADELERIRKELEK